MSKISELTQFDSTKSMIRYLPAKGTAGLVRLAVSALRRAPSPAGHDDRSSLHASPRRNTISTLTIAKETGSVRAASLRARPLPDLWDDTKISTIRIVKNGKCWHTGVLSAARRNPLSFHCAGNVATSPGRHERSERALMLPPSTLL